MFSWEKRYYIPILDAFRCPYVYLDNTAIYDGHYACIFIPFL